MSENSGKKSSRRKYHNVTSLKISTILVKKNLTENNNSNKVIHSTEKRSLEILFESFYLTNERFDEC